MVSKSLYTMWHYFFDSTHLKGCRLLSSIFQPKGEPQDLDEPCLPYTFCPSFIPSIGFWHYSLKIQIRFQLTVPRLNFAQNHASFGSHLYSKLILKGYILFFQVKFIMRAFPLKVLGIHLAIVDIFLWESLKMNYIGQGAPAQYIFWGNCEIV